MASRKWARAVLDYLTRSGLSQAQLARRAGLSKSALNNYLIDAHDREPTRKQVGQINAAIGEIFGLDIFTQCLDAIYVLENDLKPIASKQSDLEDIAKLAARAIDYFCGAYASDSDVLRLSSEISADSSNPAVRKLLLALVNRWYARLVCIVDRSAPKTSRFDEMLAIFDKHGHDLRPILIDERTRKRLQNYEEFERLLQRTLFELSNGEVGKKSSMNGVLHSFFEDEELKSGRMHPATLRNGNGELELKPLGKITQRLTAYHRIMSAFDYICKSNDQECAEISAICLDLSAVV